MRYLTFYFFFFTVFTGRATSQVRSGHVRPVATALDRAALDYCLLQGKSLLPAKVSVILVFSFPLSLSFALKCYYVFASLDLGLNLGR